MAETTGTAPVDSSPSLAEFVGDLHGDFLTGEPESDAGAPPAATPETPESEGTAAAPAEAQPAVAETVPDPSAPAPESDPLEGATPFGYTVNGEARPFDGITRLKSGEGIVEAEAMALLERRLSERDHLYERSQEQFRQIEDLGKLTEWPVTGPNGQTTVLSGREGVQAQRVALGNLAVEVRELRSILSDPQKIAQLLLLDEQNGISLNADALATLNTRVENAQLKTREQVRTAMARFGATPAPAAAAQTFDPATHASEAVQVAIKSANITGLTGDDLKLLERQASRYIRQATPADVQQSAGAFKLGQPIVDGEFAEIVKDRAQLRASTAKTVTNASDAARLNAANLAAASVGKKPTAPARQPAAAPNAATEREQAEDDAFRGILVTGANIMRQPQGA